MNNVEADLAVKRASREISGELPEVIMEPLSTPVFLPKESPTREIEVNKSDIWQGSAGESSGDSLASFVVSKHPDAVEPRSLQYEVPAHARV